MENSSRSNDGEHQDVKPVGELFVKQSDSFLAAPENWRRRASTASGLLSVGAAALLGSLLLGPLRDLPRQVPWLVSVAAVSYLAAVVLFMHAATRAPVSVDYDADSGHMKRVKGKPRTTSIPQGASGLLLWEEAKLQVESLQKLVFWGKISAILAIIFTVASVLVLFWSSGRTGIVSIEPGNTLQRIHQLCPGFDAQTNVVVERDTESAVTFAIPADLCKFGKTRITVSPLEAAISFQDS